jgi:hypothetical protein
LLFWSILSRSVFEYCNWLFVVWLCS